MLSYKLLYLASLVTFTFGALTFSVLTVAYWRELRLHRKRGRDLFHIFTLVCAAAFLINIYLQIASAQSLGAAWATVPAAVLQLTSGLLFPLLFHLVYADETGYLPWRRFWRGVLVAFYSASILVVLGSWLNNAGLLAGDWDDPLETAPILILAAAAFLGVIIQVFSRRSLNTVDRRQRMWVRILLLLMLAGAATDFAVPGPFVSLIPDYVLLGYFCVTLYYKERLTFFDLLIKRGAFFAAGLVGLTLLCLPGLQFLQVPAADWSRPWICALVLTPLWLAGPWIYRRLERFIDRKWLRRIYSTAEAEKKFVCDIQAAATEEDLLERAARSLSDIFQTPAEVCLGPDGDQGAGLACALEHNGSRLGTLILTPRPDLISFMSDDQRLLQSLARTMSVMVDNVRLRQQHRTQEEREHRLHLLAGRAELRALRAQINPHFLFNALNAIAALIHDHPRLADETIEQLAQVFRYTLRRSEKEWARLDEEIEFAASYLKIEKARFGERLLVEIDVPPDAAAIPLPAMSIQPLVENAIRHGAAAVVGEAIVRLHATMDEQALLIEVYDNGPGFSPDFSLEEPDQSCGPGGHGLCNIVERLKGYYGNSAELRWESSNQGTHVLMKIPRTPAPDLVGSNLSDAHLDRR